MNIYISDYSCVVCMSVCVRSFHLHLPLLVDTDATLENSSCSSAIYRKSAEHLLPTIKTRKYTHKRKNANTCSGNFVVDIDSTVQWLSVQIFFNTQKLDRFSGKPVLTTNHPFLLSFKKIFSQWGKKVSYAGLCFTLSTA